MLKPKYKKDHVVASVVAVIINDAGDVLLTRRNIPPFMGEWVMPGGKIDLGEHIATALQREVMEEVGLSVEVQTLLDVFERVTPGEDNNHFVILYYRCRPLSHDIVHNETEVAEACWVPPAKLSNYKMPDGAAFILGRLFPAPLCYQI